jgi:hypothetical protein
MRILLTLFLALVILPGFGQRTPEEIIRSFFATYVSGEEVKALDDLYRLSPWISSKSDNVAHLKSQVVAMKELVGKFYGYEEIAQLYLTDHLVQFDYLVLYDRQPVRFRFQFYRADKEWITFGFSFDDSLDDELEEAIKGKYFR